MTKDDRAMKSFDVVPFERIGPYELGASREALEKLAGPLQSQHLGGGWESLSRTLVPARSKLGNAASLLVQMKNGRAASVKLISEDGRKAQAVYRGIELLGRPVKEVLNALGSAGIDTSIRTSLYEFPLLGLSLGVCSDDEESNPVTDVMVYGPEYFDEIIRPRATEEGIQL
jgi:hypothetical protein